jgi:hypothetical protein
MEVEARLMEAEARKLEAQARKLEAMVRIKKAENLEKWGFINSDDEVKTP